MTYDVIVQPCAEEEIQAGYSYLSKEGSAEVAQRWFNQLDEAISTLGELPRRCSLAPEDTYFEEEIRQLLVKPYRVLFTIRGSRVHVLHVRHMARRELETRK